MNLLSVSRIHYKFNWCFTNILLIHYLFPKFTKLWSHYRLCDSVWTTWCFTKLLWIHYLFYEFITNLLPFSRIQFKFTLNTLSVSWNHFIFIIFFANSVRIHYLFHEITLNFNVLREFKSNALLILGIRIDSTIFFANPL